MLRFDEGKVLCLQQHRSLETNCPSLGLWAWRTPGWGKARAGSRKAAGKLSLCKAAPDLAFALLVREQRSFARAHIKRKNQEKDTCLLGQGQLGKEVWHGFALAAVWKLLVAEAVMLGKGKAGNRGEVFYLENCFRVNPAWWVLLMAS